MVLCRISCRHLASAQPLRSRLPLPGLLRLGLDASTLDDVMRATAEDGPVGGLGWLVKNRHLHDDPAQQRGAATLHTAWLAARTYAAEYPLWERRHAAWELECERLLAEHARKLEDMRRQGDKQSGRTANHQMDLPPPKLPKPPAKLQLSTQGCYLWGDVGRGKSLLLDLFALALQAHPLVPSPSADLDGVQRIHFHEFMHKLHRYMHKTSQENEVAISARDTMRAFVTEFSVSHPSILCFDEFQVTNISDASILTPLFKEIFMQDTVLVLTSNRPPDGLYQEGLNRHLFLPEFISTLKAHVKVHHVDAQVDYREFNNSGKAEPKTASLQASSATSSSHDSTTGSYYVVPDGSGHGLLDGAFKAAVGNSTPGTCQLPIAWGRKLQCREAGAGVVRFTFNELCGKELSADDYLALVTKSHLHTFVISDVPRFTLDLHNEARRFTNLVDCLYENQCLLICTAEVPAEQLLSSVEQLSTVDIKPEPTIPLDASTPQTEKKFHKHGDLSFEASALSPCRPDTFATAEADAEAGTSVIQLSNTVGGDGSDTSNGIAGVMPAAVDSLRESGFAAKRCVSRLSEMNTLAYRAVHGTRWLESTAAA